MFSYWAPPASRPAPRRTARSMLSLGTELDFALAMASASVGLPAGAPPPVRAATSTFLMSLANSLPRRASTTAFLCLVVAHLLCPLIPGRSLDALPHDVGEQSMHARVAGQLRMECRGQQRPLAHRDDSIGRAGEHLDTVAAVLDPRSSDEHAVQRRLAVDAGEGDVALPRVDLSAEGVATHRHVDAPYRHLVRGAVQDTIGEQDHPRARTESGHSLP